MDKDDILLVPVVQERTQYVDRHVTIHEHRAPTDASVRLLNELQDKALDDILSSIPMKSNDFEGHLLTMKDHASDGELFIATAVLNGKRIEARGQFNRFEKASDRDRFDSVRQALAEKIAAEALIEPFMKALAARTIC